MDRARVFVWQFRDPLSTRQHISLKISTKIIFNLSQWQQNQTTTTDKISCHFFFHVDNISWGFCLYANDFAGNRPRDLCRGACVDIFRQWMLHRVKTSDWSTRDHVTLPNSKSRQYLHHLFISVERRLIAKRARGRSPIAKVIYPSQKIW